MTLDIDIVANIFIDVSQKIETSFLVKVSNTDFS